VILITIWNERLDRSYGGFIIVTVARLRMAQPAQTQTPVRPRGRAIRPMRHELFWLNLGRQLTRDEGRTTDVTDTAKRAALQERLPLIAFERTAQTRKTW